MRRTGTLYLVLVVGAYMVGLGNVWRFPKLLLEYGTGGLLLYLVFVVIFAEFIAITLEVARRKVGRLIEYYNREFGLPSLPLAFLIFDIMFLGYYSTVGGWSISGLFVEDPPKSVFWTLLSVVAFIILVFLIPLWGRDRVFDFMVVSLLIFIAMMGYIIWDMYIHVGGNGPTLEKIHEIMVWKGLSIKMAVEMAAQAAYSLGVGLGFYLILGTYLPSKVSPKSLAFGGALLDTLSSFLGLGMTLLAVSIVPTAAATGTEIVFHLVPWIISNELNLPLLRFGFNVTVLLAAISSMIPLGEVASTIYADATGMHREDGILTVAIITIFIGVLNTLLISYGVDAIGLFDSIISMFIFFGAIISIMGFSRENISLPEKLFAGISVVLTGAIGLHYLIATLLRGDYLAPGAIIAAFIIIFLLNSPLRKSLGKINRRRYLSHL